MIRNAIPLDIPIDLILVVAVVAECIKDLRELQVRQMVRDFLRESPQTPKLNNGTNSGFGTLDYRLAT